MASVVQDDVRPSLPSPSILTDLAFPGQARYAPSLIPRHSAQKCDMRCIVYVAKRENPIVNRLNKTKIVRDVDHEAERQERIKRENQVKRAAAAQKVRFRPSSPTPTINAKCY